MGYPATVSNLVKAIKPKVTVIFSRKYLLCTNTVISIAMSCLGDGLQQKYQLSKKQLSCWNKRRSRDVAFTGFLIGPFCHYWYILLDWWLPGKSVKIVTKKLIVDQMICSPVVIGSFLLATSYLEGKRGNEIKTEVIEKGQTLYKAEWLIWPPAQVVNFWFLPTKYRVLFDNTVSFWFDWYYSHVKYGVCGEDDQYQKFQAVNKLKQYPDGHYEHIGSSYVETFAHYPLLHVQAAEYVQYKQERKAVKGCIHHIENSDINKFIENLPDDENEKTVSELVKS